MRCIRRFACPAQAPAWLVLTIEHWPWSGDAGGTCNPTCSTSAARRLDVTLGAVPLPAALPAPGAYADAAAARSSVSVSEHARPQAGA